MAKKTAVARALTHLPHFNASCNDLIEGPEDTIKALAKAGHVDPEPAAVAYAKAQKKPVVRLDETGTRVAEEVAKTADASAAADANSNT